MANADLQVTVHASQLELNFEKNGIWAQLFRDRTAEMGDGTTLSLPMDSLTHADTGQNEAQLRGTTAANLAWGAPTIMTSGKADLVANTGYDFYEAVGDLVRQTIRPDLMSESARQHGRLYANNVSVSCRAAVVAVTIPAANQVAYNVATADWGETAHQISISNSFKALKTKMNRAGAPTMGRVAVVNTETETVINDYMESKNFHFAGPINDRLVQLGEFPQYQGFTIVPDVILDEGHTAAQEARQDIFGLVAGEGVSLARRIGLAPEIFRDRVYKAMSIQGSYLYGVAAHQPSKLFMINVNIT